MPDDLFLYLQFVFMVAYGGFIQFFFAITVAMSVVMVGVRLFATFRTTWPAMSRK